MHCRRHHEPSRNCTLLAVKNFDQWQYLQVTERLRLSDAFLFPQRGERFTAQPLCTTTRTNVPPRKCCPAWPPKWLASHWATLCAPRHPTPQPSRCFLPVPVPLCPTAWVILGPGVMLPLLLLPHRLLLPHYRSVFPLWIVRCWYYLIAHCCHTAGQSFSFGVIHCCHTRPLVTLFLSELFTVVIPDHWSVFFFLSWPLLSYQTTGQSFSFWIVHCCHTRPLVSLFLSELSTVVTASPQVSLFLSESFTVVTTTPLVSLFLSESFTVVTALPLVSLSFWIIHCCHCLTTGQSSSFWIIHCCHCLTTGQSFFLNHSLLSLPYHRSVFFFLNHWLLSLPYHRSVFFFLNHSLLSLPYHRSVFFLSESFTVVTALPLVSLLLSESFTVVTALPLVSLLLPESFTVVSTTPLVSLFLSKSFTVVTASQGQSFSFLIVHCCHFLTTGQSFSFWLICCYYYLSLLGRNRYLFVSESATNTVPGHCCHTTQISIFECCGNVAITASWNIAPIKVTGFSLFIINSSFIFKHFVQERKGKLFTHKKFPWDNFS